MATAYTSLLGLALPVTGELAGTWGDTVNNSITSLLDSAVSGTTTLSTDADVTLTTTTGASNQARQAILLCSGARTVLRNITAPAQSKLYVVINSTTGGFGVVIRGVGPTTGVTVANGKTAVVVWNGTDFVEVAPAVATNLSGGAAGSVPYQSAANTTTFLAIGAANYVLTSTGTAPTWTLNTGTGSVVRATSPTLVTPILGTPQSGTLTNCTGLPISTGVSGLGAGIATFLATPSSANLATAVTDETGTGALVFGTSPTLATPTFTTSATFPLHIGGTTTTSTLTLRSTSSVGTTGADIIFQVGNNGATEAARILNNGNMGIGTTSPTNKLTIGAGDLQIDNAQYVRGKIAAGTTTRMLGINASDTLFIGSVDAAVSSITFNVNGTTYGGFDASGNVNFTGNVILGNATTDTVTVNGYMSVGGTPTASQGLRVIPSGLTGTSQFGSVLSLTATSAATAGVEAARVQAGTAAAAFTTAYAAGLWVRDALRGAGSTITNNYGIYIDEKVAGTNNYGLVSVVAAGANKWNLYIDGTAANYFAGNVGIGTVTPGSPLTIGTATAIPLLINGQTTGASYISITNTGGAYVGGVNNSAGSAIVSGLAYSSLVGTNNATALQLTTNGNARLTVDSAGNVGIGTNAPGTLLQVQQTLANTYTSTSAIDAVPIGSLTSIVNLAQAADVFRGVNFSSRSAAGDLQNAYFGAVSTATGNSPIFVWGQRTGATAYAERMRITSAGEVLIGATAAINSSKLLVAGVTGSNPAVIQGGAAASAVLAFYNNAATNNRFMIGQGYGTASDNIAFIQNYVSAALVFGTNSTERMRVDASGNVGIGTNAPTTLVQASKTQNADTSISVVNLDTGAAASSSVQAGSDSGNAILAAYGSGFTPTGVRLASSAALLTSAASTGGLSIGARNAAGVIRFSTGGDTERMRIDSAGNLGLGITPSAWRTAAGTKALQIGVGGALFSQDSSGTYWTVLTSNSFQNTSNVDAYINTGFATSYTQTSGKHVWATAPSGTAGATITFTSAMTLDASGNLGIGTTTPTNLLSLGGNAARTIWMERHTTANTAGNNLTLQSGGATSGATDKTGGTLLLSSGTATGTGTSIITFLTATAGSTGTVDNAPAERMRINSTGNLLIGGTTPQGNSRIELLGTNDATSAISLYRSDLSHRTVIGANYIGTFTASSFSVFSNSLERITALSSGNVGIGTTTPVNKLQVNGSFGRNAPVTKTGNFTLGDAENWLICNGTATITVTLPAASSWTGREVMLKTIAAFTVVSASSNVVPLIGGAAGTAILAATAGKWVTLVSDGTNWITMAGA